MANWNGIPYVARRMWVLALCGTLLTGCSTGDITLPGINQDPTANAGVDLTTDVGQRVTLNGLGSTDADDDPLTFSWQQRSGPSVTLDGPNTVQPSFVPIEDGFYEFALTVTDGRGGSDISVVRVFVGNVDPATCCPSQKLRRPCQIGTYVAGQTGLLSLRWPLTNTELRVSHDVHEPGRLRPLADADAHRTRR